MDLFDDPVLTMILMDHKIAILPSEIVGDDRQRTAVFFSEGFKPLTEISDTTFSFEAYGTIIIFRLAY